MASTNADKVRSALMTGVDTNDLTLSLLDLLLAVLAATGTNGSDPNPFRDVLAQCAAVGTRNSTAAILYLRQTFNTAANQGK